MLTSSNKTEYVELSPSTHSSTLEYTHTHSHTHISHTHSGHHCTVAGQFWPGSNELKKYSHLCPGQPSCETFFSPQNWCWEKLHWTKELIFWGVQTWIHNLEWRWFQWAGVNFAKSTKVFDIVKYRLYRTWTAKCSSTHWTQGQCPHYAIFRFS